MDRLGAGRRAAAVAVCVGAGVGIFESIGERFSEVGYEPKPSIFEYLEQDVKGKDNQKCQDENQESAQVSL